MIEGFSVAAERHVDQQLGLRKVQSLADLPREVRKQIESEAQKIVNKDVFGADHKTDRKTGLPVEQGLGSWEQPTLQSIEAYKKYHRADPDYENSLKLMEARLEEFRAEQKAKRKKDGDDD